MYIMLVFIIVVAFIIGAYGAYVEHKRKRHIESEAQKKKDAKAHAFYTDGSLWKN